MRTTISTVAVPRQGEIVHVSNGGKPSKGTKADKRLKENKGRKLSGSSGAVVRR